MSRIDALRELLAATPDDAFTRYALAMELSQAGRAEEALAEFQALIARAPEYTPSYLMAGQCAEGLGRLDVARAIYRQGVIACAAANEAHARTKCEQALADLEE